MKNVGYFVRLTRRIHQRDEGFNLVFLKLKTKFSEKYSEFDNFGK